MFATTKFCNELEADITYMETQTIFGKSFGVIINHVCLIKYTTYQQVIVLGNRKNHMLKKNRSLRK